MKTYINVHERTQTYTKRNRNVSSLFPLESALFLFKSSKCTNFSVMTIKKKKKKKNSADYSLQFCFDFWSLKLIIFN